MGLTGIGFVAVYAVVALVFSDMAACAAANLATGTLNAEQLT